MWLCSIILVHKCKIETCEKLMCCSKVSTDHSTIDLLLLSVVSVGIFNITTDTEQRVTDQVCFLSQVVLVKSNQS